MNEVMEGLKQVFLTVLTFSAYAAVIALAVMAVRALLGKRLPALFSCALWGIVMLRLLLPVSLPIPPVFDIPQAQVGQNTQMSGIPSTRDSLVGTDASGYPASRDKSEQSAQSILAKTEQYEVSAEQVGEKPFDLTAWLAFVWAAGFAALTARTAAGYVLMRRRFKIAVPIGRGGFVGLCAGLAGTRYQGDIYVSDECCVPVLFGLLHPKIILPVSAAQMTDEELKHVILHELAHRKRGDMVVKALWSLLLFLNWFNPVLWLADRLMAHDMERACDEAVIRILGIESKKAYALSLLNAALDLSPKAGTSEALAFAKGGVKHRIENILNFKKAGKAVTTLSLVIVLTLGTVLLAACQPTPTIEPVVGRQEDVLASVIAEQTPEAVPDSETESPVAESPVVFKKIETPAHITETHNDYEKLDLSIDADITVPDATAYSVTEVTQRAFTKDDILSFIKLLAGRNDELYAEWNLNKDEWLEKLTKLKQLKDSGIVNKEWLKTVQDNYNEAPATVENRRMSSIDDLMVSGQGANCYVKNANGEISSFSVYNQGEILGYNRSNYMGICPASDYEDADYSSNWDTKEHFNWCKPGEPDISQEDAYSKVKQVLDTMGFDLELYTAEPCSIIVDSTDKTTGWQFVFTRAVSGLQMYFDTGGCFIDPNAMPSYGAPWSQEICTIAADKDGVCFMYWRGASTVGRTAVASAELEPFAGIQQRITNQFGYLYGAIENGSDRKMDIDIFNIKLGISMISVKDKPDFGVYIPTWYVSYHIDSDESTLEQLMFSALDGSYIEPRVDDLEMMGKTG